MPEDLLGKYQNYTKAKMTKTQKALGDQAKCMSLTDAVGDYVCNHLILEKIW